MCWLGSDEQGRMEARLFSLMCIYLVLICTRPRQPWTKPSKCPDRYTFTPNLYEVVLIRSMACDQKSFGILMGPFLSPFDFTKS